MSTDNIQIVVGEFAYDLGKTLLETISNLREVMRKNAKPTGDTVLEAQKKVADAYVLKCRDMNIDLIQFIEECREVGVEEELIDHMKQSA
jgi:hypothetical protein